MNSDDVVNELNESLGLFEAVMFGIGGMIGAGVFALSGLLAVELGWDALFAITLASINSLATGYIYGKFSTEIVGAGGGFQYTRTILNDKLSFVSGWWFFLAYSLAGSFYSGVFGLYVEILTGFNHIVASVAVIVFFLIVNYVGVEESARAQSVLTLFKVFVLLIIVVVGYFNTESFRGFVLFKHDVFDILVYSATMFIAFEGFDIIATLSQEIKNPKKNVVKATFISIFAVTLIYLGVIVLNISIVIAGNAVYNYYEEIILLVAENSLGYIGYLLLYAGAVVSTLSAYNATLIASSRVAYALSKAGHFPEKMNNINEKTKTPHVSVLVASLIVGGTIIYSDVFYNTKFVSYILGKVSSLAFLLAFIMVQYAFVKHLKKKGLFERSSFNVVIVSVALILSSVFAIVILIGDLYVLILYIFLTVLGFGIDYLSGKKSL